MGACRIVKIKNKSSLYKENEPANSIELLHFEEVGYSVVSQKDLYEVGDTVIFIQPDYLLPDSKIFEDYIRPNGDASRSKLGSNNRIRAVKFNFHKGDGLPVYSCGIVLPINILWEHNLLSKDKYEKYEKGISVSNNEDIDINNLLDDILEITKGEEDSSLPFGMYKTDEENINNLWNSIKYPITLIGTQKIDGSSITIYSKCDKDGNRISGICSRNNLIPFTKKIVDSKIKYNILSKFFFWIKKHLVGLNQEDIYTFKEVINDSEFITVGKPYLEALNTMLEGSNISLALRGELNGKGLKGSGNKNNPSIKEEPNIKFYAVDDYSLGTTIRGGESDIITALGFTRCKKYFTRKMRCKSDIINLCEQIIAKEKANGNIIEGIVLKTADGTFSTKYMNLEYDSKK